MSKEVRISKILIPKLYEAFNDTKHAHLIVTSGRAGTKLSFGAIREIYKTVLAVYVDTIALA